MTVRYLEADQVKLQSSAPAFVEPGHCLWCNKPLTGKATKYCCPTEEEKEKYRYYDYSPSSIPSDCLIGFNNYWYSRPAYVRATFIRDNFTCQECGFHQMRKDKPWLPDMSNLECDHIVPLARGGETEMANLQTLCRKCNRKKAARLPDELEGELPQVIPSRDKTKCPSCRATGYRILPWQPPDYFDPLMIKVRCKGCGKDSYIGPAPGQRRLVKA